MRLGYLAHIIGKSPKNKGDFGEMIVKSVFQTKAFRNIEYYLFNDVYVEDADCVRQIDHILIMSSGIFVIETKKISGRILGSDDDFQWTVYHNKQQFKLYNPLKQNLSHVKAIRKLLNNEYNIESLVVFVNENKPKCKTTEIVNFSELKQYLLDFKNEVELTSDEMKEIADVLIENEKNKKELMRRHNKEIN